MTLGNWSYLSSNMILFQLVAINICRDLLWLPYLSTFQASSKDAYSKEQLYCTLVEPNVESSCWRSFSWGWDLHQIPIYEADISNEKKKWSDYFFFVVTVINLLSLQMKTVFLLLTDLISAQSKKCLSLFSKSISLQDMCNHHLSLRVVETLIQDSNIAVLPRL